MSRLSALTAVLNEELKAELGRRAAEWARDQSDSTTEIQIVDLQIAFGLRIISKPPRRVSSQLVHMNGHEAEVAGLPSLAQVREALARPGRDPTGIQRTVLDILAAKPGPSSPQAIGAELEALGIERNPKSVHSLLNRMTERGYIRWYAHGRYAAPAQDAEDAPMDS
jgi:hypothetical protein